MQVALVVLAAMLSGCAEKTWIRTSPPGATVWVNERTVGTSPVVYRVHRPEFSREQRYRIDLPGYEVEEGVLTKRTSPGRIIGAVFSLGLSLTFKPPTSFASRYDIPLRRSEASTGMRPVHQEPAQPSRAQWGPAADLPHSGPSTAEGLESRLRRLKEARDRGLITEEEYRAARARILNDL